MKECFLGTIFLVTLLTLSIGINSASARGLMSDDKKQLRVEQLESVIESGEYAEMLGEWVDGKVIINYDLVDVKGDHPQSRLERNRFFGNGKYNIRIGFEKDGDFPRMYGGAITFKDDKTITFNDHWRHKIATHYFGHNYEKYQALVYGVGGSVTIDVLVSSSAELAEILKDNRIKSVRHVGVPRSSGAVPLTVPPTTQP